MANAGVESGPVVADDADAVSSVLCGHSIQQEDQDNRSDDGEQNQRADSAEAPADEDDGADRKACLHVEPAADAHHETAALLTAGWKQGRGIFRCGGERRGGGCQWYLTNNRAARRVRSAATIVMPATVRACTGAASVEFFASALHRVRMQSTPHCLATAH